MDVIIAMIIVYACGLMLCFYLKLEWIHPAVVHALLWLFSSVLAFFFSEEKYLPKVYFILYANLAFFLAAIIGGETILPKVMRKMEVKRKGLWPDIIPFTFILSFYMVFFLKFSVSTIWNISAFREYLVADDGANFGLLGRLALLSLFSSCFLLITSRKLFLLSFVLAVPMLLLLGAKVLVLLYLSTILILTPKRLKLSKVILFGGGFILCFLGVMSLRYPDAPPSLMFYYLYNYMSGGILAFSQLTDTPSDTFGFYSFRNIYLWLGFLYPFKIANIVQEWVFVPFPTNIYTYLRPYFMDFGYFSIIFPAFLGFISGRIYTWKYKNVRAYYIVYPITLYAILMQLIDDQYFTWLANWILLIFVGYLMTCGRKNVKDSGVNSHI
ncbi:MULTISPECIES: O-antigen polymerase [Enterobacter]|uniref:O-antigen polymerase n=1 Tax=Enterobacter TaxID=547 RepID=UPI0006661101|nr:MULTISPECIES: O-antigen polymerase [Enterobacter]MBE4871281.1 oligosaccharide repeat unit polymerase [Enterobacter cloacae complex sp. P38RS]HDR2409657.1 oligosaccharide repeat unit polymerase [Enterobacter bugandensis]HDR2595654.1 oligosaccharide repeat unit polymerase [Enterobacter bugandensis]